jgi:nucleotide-binding universal stress UspA family protein
MGTNGSPEMIKDLVVNLSLNDKPDATADFAVSVASNFSAHVLAVSFLYEPDLTSIDFAPIPAAVVDMQAEESERLSTNARTRFEESVRRNSISAEFQAVTGSPTSASGTFARIARRFDLSVLSQPGPDAPNSDMMFVEAALFTSGRPVLVVPYIQRANLKLDRVLVCWDGSRTAARAIADALPFLARAKTTEVVTVTDSKSQADEIAGADIAKHLARHGLNVELQRIVAGDVDTANVILSHAADTSADFIVMGGYGHSRWREFVLGGVTRGLLSSMTVPTFMSH